MLLDLCPYLLPASVFLIIGLRLFFGKPKQPEFVFLRSKPEQRDRRPK